VVNGEMGRTMCNVGRPRGIATDTGPRDVWTSGLGGGGAGVTHFLVSPSPAARMDRAATGDTRVTL